MDNTRNVVTDAGNAPRVIFLVTLEDHGFNYLTSRDTWSLEHNEGLAFESESEAQEVANSIKDASVLCSAR